LVRIVVSFIEKLVQTLGLWTTQAATRLHKKGGRNGKPVQQDGRKTAQLWIRVVFHDAKMQKVVRVPDDFLQSN
jgi:hypothetical protein